jgi:hypothetical protein
MILEASDYLADHDNLSMERLRDAGTLLVALGEREAAGERQAAGQPELRGLVV